MTHMFHFILHAENALYRGLLRRDLDAIEKEAAAWHGKVVAVDTDLGHPTMHHDTLRVTVSVPENAIAEDEMGFFEGLVHNACTMDVLVSAYKAPGQDGWEGLGDV